MFTYSEENTAAVSVVFIFLHNAIFVLLVQFSGPYCPLLHIYFGKREMTLVCFNAI